MRYRELLEAIRKDSKVDDITIKAVMTSALNVMGESFANGEKKIMLDKFGILDLRERKETETFNCMRNRYEHHDAKKSIRFRASDELTALLNK